MVVSKYTTEVRFICEQKAGLTESVGCDDVDKVISDSWDKIFTKKAPFFDENYRSILCSKILKHYYLKEIGCETVGIWKLWMNCKLEEIMPYYNQLYESALLKFDPFKDVDYTKTHEGEDNGKKNVKSNGKVVGDKDTDTVVDRTGRIVDDGEKSVHEVLDGKTDRTLNSTVSDVGNYTDTGTVGDARDITDNIITSGTLSKSDRYSDTPQGSMVNMDIEGDVYLTNARLIGENTSGSSSETKYDNNLQTKNLAGTTDNTRLESTTDKVEVDNVTDTTESVNNVKSINDRIDTVVGENSKIDSSNNVDETVENTDSYIERVFGKMGTMPYSDLLKKFRETFLNIDMMVIEEFNELFLRLW